MGTRVYIIVEIVTMIHLGVGEAVSGGRGEGGTLFRVLQTCIVLKARTPLHAQYWKSGL